MNERAVSWVGGGVWGGGLADKEDNRLQIAAAGSPAPDSSERRRRWWSLMQVKTNLVLRYLRSKLVRSMVRTLGLCCVLGMGCNHGNPILCLNLTARNVRPPGRAVANVLNMQMAVSTDWFDSERAEEGDAYGDCEESGAGAPSVK